MDASLKQLRLDLKEGESWHVEFKEYTLAGLNDTKTVDGWKTDLAHELAAMASTGGRIYIGIADNGDLKGISGKEQDWHEKLFKRAFGHITPKISWKSHVIVEPKSKLKLIVIDLPEGEPIYYHGGKPYIRDGTDSRQATPEEVKKRMAKKEEVTTRKSDLISWIGSILLDIFTALNLYEDKFVNPQRDVLKMQLESIREAIESKLGQIAREFGKDSEYYKSLETISTEILAASSVTMLIDGGKSWNEWLSHLKKVNETSRKLLDIIQKNIPIQIEGLENLMSDAQSKTIRWLGTIDDTLTKFINEASGYSHSLLRVALLLDLDSQPTVGKKYMTIANEIEKLSWGTSNVDYQLIAEKIPELRQRLQLIDLTETEAELLVDSAKNNGQINKLVVDAIPIPGGFIQIGSKTYGSETDVRSLSKYVSALESLLDKKLARHVSGNLFSLTDTGWKKVKG
ncbi:MAG TPA: ATP-binding protein [Candidatus Saccharimonadales bacterium]|nr:ATP-binding protein [Candidatus Saccharimonadales bacterium]